MKREPRLGLQLLTSSSSSSSSSLEFDTDHSLKYTTTTISSEILKSHNVGSEEDKVYADLTSTNIGRLFPKDPLLKKKHKKRACSSTRNQQITIFCKAQAGDCDISELQALAILWHARREMEEKYNTSGSNSRTPSLQFQLHSPYGLSLRKSLQRFLQKRRDRIQGATPY